MGIWPAEGLIFFVLMVVPFLTLGIVRKNAEGLKII